MRIHLPAYEYDDANDDEHCMEIMYACRFLFDSCLSVCLFRLEWMEEKEHKMRFSLSVQEIALCYRYCSGRCMSVFYFLMCEL